MKPISFSSLLDFRRKLLNEQDATAFIKPYLNNGSLVDALLADTKQFDETTRVLTQTYHGKTTEIVFSPEQVKEAMLLRDSFRNDSIAGVLAAYGQKESFRHIMEMEYNGTSFTVPTSGEGDLIIKSQQLGGDIKVTSCKNEKEFIKKVEKLFYREQGGWYMENLNLSQFVVCGIGRSGKLVNGYYPVYHYVIETNDYRFKLAMEWCQEYTYKYLDYNFLLDERRKMAA